jgi:hypothetical protein
MPARPASSAAAATFVDLGRLRHPAGWRGWRALTIDAPPFLSPEFITLIAPLRDGGGEALVAGAWRADEMIGALPLVRARDTLHALRTDHSPGYDFCGTAEGLAAIWGALRDDRRWNELVLDKVPAGSRLATELPALARVDGCRVVIRPDSRHPFLPLPGFEARMSPKFLANLERCARKAGGVSLERIAVPARADLDEAMAIEAMAWKAAAGTSIDAAPAVAHAYRVIARLWGRRGRGALYFLRAGERRIATLFAVEDQRTLYALKIGYDPACANLSPGHLLVWKVAAEAESRGLGELDFVGREDEWKRKWTTAIHAHVALVVYRRSPRGLAGYYLREWVKPRLPDTLGPGLHGVLPSSCQRGDLVAAHPRWVRARARVQRSLGAIARFPPARATSAAPHGRGAPSRFAVGSWVKVRDGDEVRAGLVADVQRDGRPVASPPPSDKIYRVASHVRRLRDARGRFHPVSNTVLLDGVGPVAAADAPLMCRDAWLEAAAAPHRPPPLASHRQRARIREFEEILAGLDLFGCRDGVSFLPEMRAHAGRRVAIVGQVAQVFEDDRSLAPARPIYLLDGLHCAGGPGGCDRGCALRWHRDWITFDEAPPS